MARRLVFDRGLFATVLLLTGLGLVMVYSASAVLARDSGMSFNPLFVKQSFAALLGIAAMLAAMHIDYRLLQRPLVIYSLIIGVVVLLVAVLFTPLRLQQRAALVLHRRRVDPAFGARQAGVDPLHRLPDRSQIGSPRQLRLSDPLCRCHRFGGGVDLHGPRPRHDDPAVHSAAVDDLPGGAQEPLLADRRSAPVAGGGVGGRQRALSLAADHRPSWRPRTIPREPAFNPCSR